MGFDLCHARAWLATDTVTTTQIFCATIPASELLFLIAVITMSFIKYCTDFISFTNSSFGNTHLDAAGKQGKKDHTFRAGHTPHN